MLDRGKRIEGQDARSRQKTSSRKVGKTEDSE